MTINRYLITGPRHHSEPRVGNLRAEKVRAGAARLMTVIRDAVRFMCLDLRTHCKLGLQAWELFGITMFPPTGRN